MLQVRLPVCACWDIIPVMTEPQESPASALCKSCGLCCTGHLFLWARLNAPELKPSQSLGLHVIRNDPRQRGFTLPCPLWDRHCTIYTSPNCPRVCHSYKCKLLKELLDEEITLPNALPVIQQAKEMIAELEALLPVSSNANFRGRLVARMEQGNAKPEFLLKAGELIAFYETRFGVNDLVDTPEEE